MRSRMQVTIEKKNWMIVSGVLILLTSLFFTIYFDLTLPYSKSRFESTGTFFVKFFIAPLLIAPVIEELLFRGFLSRSKVVRALFLILGVGALFFFQFPLGSCNRNLTDLCSVSKLFLHKNRVAT